MTKINFFLTILLFPANHRLTRVVSILAYERRRQEQRGQLAAGSSTQQNDRHYEKNIIDRRSHRAAGRRWICARI